MEFSTQLPSISVGDLYPVHDFKVTFSQDREHTSTSARYDGTDIVCQISCTYMFGKYLEEYESSFPIQEQHDYRGGVTEELFVTKKWNEFWSDANPACRDWKRAPIDTATKLCQLSARLLQQPTHVQVFHNGTAKRLLWLHGAVVADAAANSFIQQQAKELAA